MTRARDLANLGSNPPLSASLGGPGPFSLGTVTAKASFEDVGSLLLAASTYANGSNETRLYLGAGTGGFSASLRAYFQKSSGTIQFKAGSTVYTFTSTGQPYGNPADYVYLDGSWTGPVYTGNLDIYEVATGTALSISNPDGVTVPADLSKVYINGTAYTDVYDANNTTIRFSGPDIYSVGGSVSMYGSDDFLNGYDRDGNLARTLRFNSDTGEFATPSGPLAEARSPMYVISEWTMNGSAGVYSKVSDPLTIVRPNPSRSGRALVYATADMSMSSSSALSQASPFLKLEWYSASGAEWIPGPSFSDHTVASSNIFIGKNIKSPYIWHLDELPQGDIDIRISANVNSNTTSWSARIYSLYFVEL